MVLDGLDIQPELELASEIAIRHKLAVPVTLTDDEHRTTLFGQGIVVEFNS